MKTKLEGVQDFKKSLDRYNNRTGKAFQKGVRAAARALLDHATPNAPIDTGALRASGGWYSEGSGWNTVALVGFGFEVEGFYDDHGRERIPREYALWQHDDPYNVRWLENAVDAMVGNVETILADHIERVVP